MQDRILPSVVNDLHWTERATRIAVGVVLHSVLCLCTGVVLALVVTPAIGVVAPGAARSTELVLPVLMSALLASFAAPRCFRDSAPWVGLLGVTALFVGTQELYRGWSPIWSHQTRLEYVLSQLFGFSPGCSDSECLYLLFFGLPFLCLTTYGVASLLAQRIADRDDAEGSL
jgi:hypothetical protein